MGKSFGERNSVLHNSFIEIYPLARRAAQVRSAGMRESLLHLAFDRDDVEQEVLFGVWMALRRFDPARASLRTYVERVVATKMASVLRRAKSQKRTPTKDSWSEPSSVQLFFSVELRVDFDRALRNLTPRDRQIAELLVEHRPGQIAQVLRISRASVYRSIGEIRAAFSEAGVH